MLTWAAPLLILPGVGLLIMSTSARYARLHDELHFIHDHEAGDVGHLMRRALAFRNALVACYVAVTLLALSGLVLGIGLATTDAHVIIEACGVALTMGGVLAVVIAATLLTREAFLSFEVLEEHARRVRSRSVDPPDGHDPHAGELK